MWKRLTDGREIDPDFYVEEGEGAVFTDIAYSRRVFGWNGRMFPRLSIAVYPGWTRENGRTLMKNNRFDEPSFSLTIDYKSGQGQWWQKLDGVPLSMMDVALELLNEAKTTVLTKGERK